MALAFTVLRSEREGQGIKSHFANNEGVLTRIYSHRFDKILACRNCALRQSE